MNIEVEELLANPGSYQVIDVRTEAEFRQGSVYQSINIPLFNQEERERIGLVYKRSAKAARFVAMDLLAPKLARFVRRIHRHCQGKTPVIVCWRGGMRSKATVTLLQLVGVPALQLTGGYRRYRQHVHSLLTQYRLQGKLVVIKGKSGTGKTVILDSLGRQGLPVLDLEELAGHRGSAFGGRNGQPPASQKDFDVRLLMRLRAIDGPGRWLLVEGESKRIGNNYLPDFLFAAMRQAPVIEVTCPLAQRVERIVGEYAPKDCKSRLMMYKALARLRHKLSRDTLLTLRTCLDQQDYPAFVNTILTCYYDKIYDHQLPGREVLARVNSADIEKAAREIAAFLKIP